MGRERSRSPRHGTHQHTSLAPILNGAQNMRWKVLSVECYGGGGGDHCDTVLFISSRRTGPPRQRPLGFLLRITIHPPAPARIFSAPGRALQSLGQWGMAVAGNGQLLARIRDDPSWFPVPGLVLTLALIRPTDFAHGRATPPPRKSDGVDSLWTLDIVDRSALMPARARFRPGLASRGTTSQRRVRAEGVVPID